MKSTKDTALFLQRLWAYYEQYKRADLPWRRVPLDPYHVLVSEIMLQQTQVARVIPKYQAFSQRFPTVSDLAHAPLADVLVLWSGLGYNRRAQYLHQAAQMITKEWSGNLTPSIDALQQLPGVGHNTAAAVMAYAFNQPVVFIETNIRTVYIHHFFSPEDTVRDAEIIPLLEATLDMESPREFYWALMDYGTYIKASAGNHTRQSQHYKKQSRFDGSVRQVRGAILRHLTAGPLADDTIRQVIADDRYEDIMKTLHKEGLIERSGNTWQLAV